MNDNPTTPTPTTRAPNETAPTIAVVDLERDTTYVAGPEERARHIATDCDYWAREVVQAARHTDPPRALHAAWRLVASLAGAQIVVAAAGPGDHPAEGSASA